MQYIYFNY